MRKSARKWWLYKGRRKQVLQNSPISFRPTNEVKRLLNFKKSINKSFNKSQFINDAILFYTKPIEEILDELSLKYPFIWRRINRRNGQFITQKIKSQKRT